MKEEDLIIAIKELLNKGKTRKEIVESLDIEVNKYKHMINKHSLNRLDDIEKPYMNKEWLEYQYRKHESAEKIAELCGSNPKTITYWRQRHGIERALRGCGNRKYELNEDYFESIDTEDKAYWLGFIMADGCVSVKSENSKRLAIGLSSVDINHLYKLKNSLESNHKIYVYDVETNYTKEKKEICNLTINRKKLCDDLIRHGCIPRKSGTEYITNMESHLVRHFVRGFFDGDGSAYTYNTHNVGFSVCSSSIIILEQIKTLFYDKLKLDLKIIKSSNPIYSVDFYEIKSSNIEANKKIYEYIYTDCEIYLDRKHKKITDFLKKYCRTSE